MMVIILPDQPIVGFQNKPKLSLKRHVNSVTNSFLKRLLFLDELTAGGDRNIARMRSLRFFKKNIAY
jgi:hypothetical protein